MSAFAALEAKALEVFASLPQWQSSTKANVAETANYFEKLYSGVARSIMLEHALAQQWFIIGAGARLWDIELGNAW